jgi:uncharacterized membrane protein (UPF0127 family)
MTNRKGYVCFNDSTIEVEVAMTQEEMTVGLMGRVNLSENGGMIFIFDEERIHKIWMKNMLVSLDVIWLDDKGKIVHIDKNMVPCEGYCKPFGPESYSKFALEVGGSFTDRHNINVGDSVRMIL